MTELAGARNYRTEKLEISGTTVAVSSYQIGEQYYCHVSNIDPGATIARAEADTADDARRIAISKAELRLGKRVE